MPRIAHKRTAYCNRVLPRADLVSDGEGGNGALVQTHFEGGRAGAPVSGPACRLDIVFLFDSHPYGSLAGHSDVSSLLVGYGWNQSYPCVRRAAHHIGTVILFMIVDKNGNGRNFGVVQNLGLVLDEKAIEAVRKWHFRPGKKEANPFLQCTVEVNFRLL